MKKEKTKRERTMELTQILALICIYFVIICIIWGLITYTPLSLFIASAITVSVGVIFLVWICCIFFLSIDTKKNIGKESKEFQNRLDKMNEELLD